MSQQHQQQPVPNTTQAQVQRSEHLVSSPQPQHQQQQKQEQQPDHMLQLQKQTQMKMHEQQQNMIREQMQAQSPLIGDLFPLAMLMDEFVNNQGFYIKIQTLMPIYQQYRKTRRDGSCFYRALNYCIFQKIVKKGDKKLQAHMVDKIKKAKDHLLKANFEGIVFEDLQQIFLEKLEKNLPKNQKQLLQLFRQPGESNVMVLLLRFITSGQIKNNAFLYQTFMDQQIPAQLFCQLEVEPIDKEADQIQIMALLNYLEVGIKIVYLDASMNKEPYKVILPESFKETDIVGEVLYRPGHYDVLYK